MNLKNPLATREAYGIALAELGEQHPEIIALDADLAKATKSDIFQKRFPARFFDCGIAEQNMVGIAAGLATCGKKPFASTFAVFAAGRAYDQIRASIAYPKLNVVIAGSHGGLATGEDGATHQALEDVAQMRILPNIAVIQPADAVEMYRCVEYLIGHKGPVYLRLGRQAVPHIFSQETYRFEFGKGVQISEGDDLAIIATGAMVHEAKSAVETLSKEHNIHARLINIHTIDPLDEKIIIKAAKETGAIITCEDHLIRGGLGGAVAELLSENCPTMIKMIGVNNMFGRSGSPKELYDQYGMSKDHIIQAAKDIVIKKK